MDRLTAEEKKAIRILPMLKRKMDQKVLQSLVDKELVEVVGEVVYPMVR